MLKLIKITNNDLVIGEIIDIQTGAIILKNTYLVHTSYGEDNKMLIELIDYTFFNKASTYQIAYNNIVSCNDPSDEVKSIFDKKVTEN